MDSGVLTLSRRRLLAASTAGVAALAGCGGTNAQNSDSNDAASLGYVRVVNRDDTAHTAHVLVERDDEVVFWSSYDLPAVGDDTPTVTVEGPWADASTPAAYEVYFRIDEQNDWKTFSTADSDLDCYGLEARVNDDAGLGLWVEHQPDECGTPTATE
ncbi:hypothetical protein GL213_02415 [Halogeometricum borinquense]|uniref:Uncharacterized protein n=1 Tax=Halogeometricum borinquense TaxID=60847 RepID=A0A6C0UK96_9EURY|nr:hypothetical protein [Halogeometricum borinquense]QIB75932.1 hypothetical protein G3I44_17595 [Halogeometricum borinquense]QIQ75486.1 hypothetical protein GL213_02415 [Halogeometricum borinquense]